MQRHRASSDHYDFRIERHGRLISWAVPKGLTLDPGARRTAVRVDDHPIEYFDFEGVIPAGQCGAGDVIVWDWGTYDVVGHGGVTAGVRRGTLSLELHGERLRGVFELVRTGDAGERETWLVRHADDRFARPDWDLAEHELSVKSGRSPEAVRRRPDALWDSEAEGSEARVAVAATDEEIRELDRLPSAATWEIGGHAVRLTNLDKVLFPGGITKRDLIGYAARMAAVILPHLRDRAVNLHRYPDGVGSGKGFWQKNVPARAPAWIRRWRYVHRHDGARNYPLVDRVATLAWLGQEAAVELHPWTSRIQAPDRPSAVLVDIDPVRRRPGTRSSRSRACTAPRSSTSAWSASRR